MTDATEPAVPQGREPVAVTGQPSDGELLQMMPEQFRADLATVSRMAAHGAGTGVTPGVFRVSLNTGALDYARAVLARWGNLVPAPPANGEVAELVAWLREQLHVCLQAPWTPGIKHFGRAAELLQRQVLVPVAVSERPWEREGWCDGLGRCWWGRSETDDWSADWTLATPEAIAEFCEFSPRTVCLPAHALPVPEVRK